MNHKCLMTVACAAVSSVAFAEDPIVPTVSDVTMQSSSSRTVTITYKLSSPAVVTLDIETNVVGDVWASIGGANIQNFEPDSAVWKKVVGEAGAVHVIKWHPDLSWQDHKIANGGARAVVTAWALDNTPDYMVVDLTGTSGSVPRYYPAVEFLPGGLLENPDYRTTQLVMRKIMAKNVTWTKGSVAETGRGNLYPGVDDEKAYLVTLTNNFYIGVFEITQTQYEKVKGDNPSFFNKPGVKAMRPVDSVGYATLRFAGAAQGGVAGMWPNPPSAASFLGKLRGLTKVDFDLPSEAQWEFACRAGRGEGQWNTGDPITNATADASLPGRYAKNGGNVDNVKGGDATWDTDKGTAIVGSYSPNAWGLYDMHGNVSEWCLDYWDWDITSRGGMININPANPRQRLSGSDSTTRSLRGGSWNHEAWACRSAARNYDDEPSPGKSYGVRVACQAGLK